MRAISANATLERATFTDDGYGPVPVWASVMTLSGLLTPLSAEMIARLGVANTEATHELVLPNGVTLAVGEYRVRIGSRAYDVVRVTNTPTRALVLLRGMQP
jgi:hypothetical protein